MYRKGSLAESHTEKETFRQMSYTRAAFGAGYKRAK